MTSDPWNSKSVMKVPLELRERGYQLKKALKGFLLSLVFYSEINKRLHGMTVPQQEAVQGPWVAQRGQLLTHFAGITGPPQQSITEEWVCPLLWFSQPSHRGEKAVSNSVK